MFCRNKHTFVTTKDVFVATKVSLSQQNLCRDKHNFVGKSFVATKMFVRDFVATSILLSRQKTCFVATQMIHVAAPADDSYVRACIDIIYVCILLIIILLASLVLSQ